MIGDVLRSLGASLVAVGSKESTGTGIVIGSDEKTTTILTCAHVVGKFESVTVVRRKETSRGFKFISRKAKVVFIDETTDLALVGTLRPIDLPAVRIAEEEPALNAPIALGGNPNGIFAVCVSAELVGVPGSYAVDGDNYVYAGISYPGSSGGALVNLDNELIGIVKSIARDEEVLLPGIGFATPLPVIKKFLKGALKK